MSREIYARAFLLKREKWMYRCVTTFHWLRTPSLQIPSMLSLKITMFVSIFLVTLFRVKFFLSIACLANLVRLGISVCCWNLGQIICGVFEILAQFLFITNQMQLEYYHQKRNVRVAPRVAERLKTLDLRKSQRNPWNAWICWWVHSQPPKRQF